VLAVISDMRLSSNSGAELLKILVGPRLISALIRCSLD
jgi:hypothetical protein